MAQFKDLYSEEFYRVLSLALDASLNSFDKKLFKKMIFCDEFEGYELKERMSHTTEVMAYFLPEKFTQAIKKIKKIIRYLEKNNIREESVEFMFLPEFVEKNGLDDYQASIEAFEFITKYTSCEFAVRPFIKAYPDKMLKQMLDWASNDHHMVRRLASEGSRPRLPWAMDLPDLKKDPAPLLKILTKLRDDEAEIVRRSVANNLNDISKDNPSFLIDRVNQWQGEDKNVDAMLKHACRTLLKQGDPKILKLFGYDSKHFELSDFEISTPSVEINSALSFGFRIKNKSSSEKLARLEYGVYYLKKNNTLSKKVFKISEKLISGDSVQEIQRKQSFRVITTRTLYPGLHKLSVIINGRESDLLEFDLVD